MRELFYTAFVVALFSVASSAEFDNRTHGIYKRATDAIWLSLHQKNLIVDKHNELRKIVKPNAANMLKMSWDDDLEKLATRYTRKCVFAHNSDRKLDGYGYIGENLHVSAGTKITDEYGAGAVVSWDNEKKDYNYHTRTCRPGKPCGHYTQTAWAKSQKVGCGMSTCDEVTVGAAVWKDATIFACNYSPGGNYAGQYIYQEGIPCSKCPEGYWCDDGLCTNSASGTLHNRSMLLLSAVFFIVFLSIL